MVGSCVFPLRWCCGRAQVKLKMVSYQRIVNTRNLAEHTRAPICWVSLNNNKVSNQTAHIWNAMHWIYGLYTLLIVLSYTVGWFNFIMHVWKCIIINFAVHSAHAIWIIIDEYSITWQRLYLSFCYGAVTKWFVIVSDHFKCYWNTYGWYNYTT